MNPDCGPQIIWVLGEDTNVGKTTVSTALVRILNSAGKPALAFKPYAGARLISIVELLEKALHSDGLLAGSDVRKLAEASPLTPPRFLEVMNPSWRISHPSRDFSMLVRKGSSDIHRRDFYQTRNTVEFTKRKEFSRLNEGIGLPIQAVSVIDNLGADAVDALDQDVQAPSFKLLQELGPEVILCEGAGRLLPYWSGAPPVQHVFLVTNGDLYLFPDVNLDLNQRFGQEMKSVPTIAAIMGDLRQGMQLRDAIPVVGTASFNEQMDQFVGKFLPALH